jgi:acetyltransferase
LAGYLQLSTNTSKRIKGDNMGHNKYEGNWTLADGEKLTLRHITSADAAREQAFLHGLSSESIYRRFHGTIKDLSKKALKEFTEPDARNSVAIVVLRNGEKGEEEIGVARYVIDVDRADCEFAIVVADKWQKRGIGTRLMNALITHLQASGIKQITGSVIKSNTAMRPFMKQMGFEEIDDPGDPSTLLVTKKI